VSRGGGAGFSRGAGFAELELAGVAHAGGFQRDEWVVSGEAHLPIVSDAMFESAQERFSLVRIRRRLRRRRPLRNTPVRSRSPRARTGYCGW
jgi:hypothetical protein